MSADLLAEMQKLRRELARLNRGDHELVARLTEADRVAIAHKVVDAMDERFAAERRKVADKAPRREPPKQKRFFGTRD